MDFFFFVTGQEEADQFALAGSDVKRLKENRMKEGTRNRKRRGGEEKGMGLG